MNRIRKWFFRRRVMRKIRAAKRVLRWIDKQFIRWNMPMWKRQQIRRDIITSDKAWIDFVDFMDDK